MFSLRFMMNALAVAEPLLTVIAFGAFLRSNDRSRYPALQTLLVVRSIFTVELAIILNSVHFGVPWHAMYYCYVYAWWCSYLVTAVAVYFVIREMFKHVMEPLPGIRRVGLVAFRWAATISVVVAIASALLPTGINAGLFHAASMRFLRCTSITELCLLALLAYSARSLRLSWRSRTFGVGLGLGMMALMDFVSSVFAFRHTGMNIPLNAVADIVTAVALMTWVAYFLIPEPQSEAAAAPVDSPLTRWNEIAVALGHTSPQVAVAASNQFFLQDVEGVVEKMLTKNAMKSANE